MAARTLTPEEADALQDAASILEEMISILDLELRAGDSGDDELAMAALKLARIGHDELLAVADSSEASALHEAFVTVTCVRGVLNALTDDECESRPIWAAWRLIQIVEERVQGIDTVDSVEADHG